MESISDIARRTIDRLIRGEEWSAEALARLIEAADSDAGGKALFGILAEGLSDRFEPRLVDAYARLFSEVIASALPGATATELMARYERVRRPRRNKSEALAVYVLSRVTLGADIVVTSQVLDAAKRRFPSARIVLVGGDKSYQLFAGDPRIEHLRVGYRRGSLRERLQACPRIDAPGAIVVDPDSRLTQLGLVPVCPEESYYFFESRAYGADEGESLSGLTRRWIGETFGIDETRSYVAPSGSEEPPAAADVAVSLGVGENPAKGMPPPFEERLLGALADRGLSIIVDAGPGGEEEQRVRNAIGARQGRIRVGTGSFAAFAAIVARSRLYVGYDSSGQHAAAASGVPLVTVFAGFPCPRFYARWRPTGDGPIEIVRVDTRDSDAVLKRTLEAVDRLLHR